MDFLTRLAHRATGTLPVVQPRLPARFEPAEGTYAGAAPGGEVAAETAAPNPKPASRRASVTDPREPGHDAPQGVRSEPPNAATPHPPRATIIDSAFREDQGRHQARSARSSDAPSFQGPPTADRPAAASITPLLDADILPAPPPRRALRVDARPARVHATASQPPDTRWPAGGHPTIETGAADAAPPTVHVHIGRIDVRAVVPPGPTPRLVARPAPPPTSLERYLSGRKGGLQP
jgi:hypothetical protein